LNVFKKAAAANIATNKTK